MSDNPSEDQLSGIFRMWGIAPMVTTYCTVEHVCRELALARRDLKRLAETEAALAVIRDSLDRAARAQFVGMRKEMQLHLARAAETVYAVKPHHSDTSAEPSTTAS